MADPEETGPPVEEGDPFSDDLEVPEPEAEAQPEATPAEPETTPEAPAAAEPEPTTAEVQPGEEVPEGEPQELILGKYKTQEDLLHAHQEQERWATQNAQRVAELERERTETMRVLKEIEEREKQPQMSPEEMDFGDPQVLQQFIDQQVQQRMQAFQAEQSQVQQNQAAEQWNQSLQQFRAANPDADSHALGMRHVFDDYTDALPMTPENLPVAYQLAKQPQVKQVLDRFNMDPDMEAIAQAGEILADPNLASYVSAHPDSVFTDKEGWDKVKGYASFMAGVQQQQAGKAPDPDAEQAKLHAQERGGTGAPAEAAPGERDDAWKDIGGELYDAEKKRTAQLFSK